MPLKCQSLYDWEKEHGVKLNPCTIKGGLFWDADYMSESSFFDLVLEHGYTGNAEFNSVLELYKKEHDARIEELAKRFKEHMDENGVKYTEAGEGNGKLTVTDDTGDVVAVVGGEEGMSTEEFVSFMWNMPYNTGSK